MSGDMRAETRPHARPRGRLPSSPLATHCGLEATSGALPGKRIQFAASAPYGGSQEMRANASDRTWIADPARGPAKRFDKATAGLLANAAKSVTPCVRQRSDGLPFPRFSPRSL